MGGTHRQTHRQTSRQRRHITSRIAAVGAATSLALLAACGGGSESGEERTADPQVSVASEAPDEPIATDASTPEVTEAPPEPETDEPDPGADQSLADWTFMVYVMGDNDLEPFAVQDLLEMSAAGSTERVNIVALADRHPGYDIADDPFGNFEDTKLFLVNQDEFVESEPVGELNVGSPETLATFIETSISNFPAHNYGVVLWNHGAGWPGMGPDETDGNDILDLADINAGFEAGLAAAGVDKVDLVGFDACLMASYEVATTMAEHADFMLASEELEPGHGWNYTALEVLQANPQASPVELGQSILDGFAAQASEAGTDEDITLSLVDLGAMAALESALGELADPLMAEPKLAAPMLAAAQAGALKFGANPDPSIDSFHVDLGQVAASLGAADPTLAGPATSVQSAIDSLVVSTTSGVATSGATGMSIYFPPYADAFRQGYLFLEDIPVWPDLLQSFYAAGAALPQDEQAAFVNADGQGDYFFDEDGLNLFGTFDLASQPNLVEAEIFYGVLDEDDGSIIFIGEEEGDVFDDGSGTAAAIYDLTVMTISDGEDTDFAYIDLDFDLDAEFATLDVPLWYFAPDDIGTDVEPQDVLLSIVLDLDFNILSEVYYAVNADGTTGELSADPGGLIFPVVLNQYPDGSQEWLTLSERGLFASLPDLQYDFVPLDPGTGLYAELVIRDYGGNTSSVSMFDLVPG